ncbi:minor tail protein [Arthrobacter phage CallinAllBarbz]|uniref:Minor tail protein n=1 Tax=Arthrobacter phage CallinAllBarbz TaxID=3077790 RepID=A0AA96HJB9_9CAUD|nr:minor tail protein [Arthrobacter phage CallinAllBarbz]
MNNFDLLIPERYTPTDVFRFGTITSEKPFRVKLDGDTSPTEATPILTVSVAVGDRVFVQIHNRQLMVVGRVGGFWGITTLGPGEDLNNYDQSGLYHQNLSVDAASGANYPVNSAGMLEVSRGSGGGQIFQRYTQYLSREIYTRTRYNGNWNAWKRVITEDDNGQAAVSRLRLTATDDASETSTNQPFQIGPNGGFRVVMDQNELLAFSSDTTYGNFFIHGRQLGLQGRTTNSSFGPFMENVDGPSGSNRAGLKQSGSSTYFQVEGMWTSTAAANCYVNTSGTLYRSTSVRAAKLAIEDISERHLDALEKVRVRTWFDKRDAEQLAADLENGTADRTELGPLKRIPGVVAEEIEDLGLEPFLLRDEDGALSGVAYDRLGVASFPLIRRQAARIDALEKRLAALENLILQKNEEPTS